ncbi:MAG: hypothetical protein GY930_11250 [bacterium]|nr:hypothetical protein [bacterium]
MFASALHLASLRSSETARLEFLSTEGLDRGMFVDCDEYLGEKFQFSLTDSGRQVVGWK